MNPSGLRIGIPAQTTQSMVEEDMCEIARVSRCWSAAVYLRLSSFDRPEKPVRT